MALFNHVKKEVNAKIVYFGPASAGKETSLSHIYRKLNPELRSPFKSMNVQGAKMLFFDFQPSEKGIEGYAVRFHLYTVPDEASDPSVWQLVLKGADGVVFVADSDPLRLDENARRMQELQELLAKGGQSPDEIPLVFQYNRRDHDSAVSMQELNCLLNPRGELALPTVATAGEGVLTPLSQLIKMVLVRVRESLSISAEREETSAPLMVPPIPAGEAETVETPSLEAAPLPTLPPELPVCQEPSVRLMPAVLLPGGVLNIPIELEYGEETRVLNVTVSVGLQCNSPTVSTEEGSP